MLVPLYNPQVKLLAFTFLYYSKWDFVPGNVADGRAADERCDREIRRTRGPSPYGDEGPHRADVCFRATPETGSATGRAAQWAGIGGRNCPARRTQPAVRRARGSGTTETLAAPKKQG